MREEEFNEGDVVRYVKAWQHISKDTCRVVSHKEFTDDNPYRNYKPEVVVVEVLSKGKPYTLAYKHKTKEGVWGVFTSVKILERAFIDYKEDQPLEGDDDI